MSYAPSVLVIPPPPTVSTHSRHGIGLNLFSEGAAGLGSGAWQGAKRVLYVPIWLDQAMTIQRVWWCNGTTAATNKVDCGVYNAALGLPTTKIISNGTGTTASGTSILQSVSVTPTTIGPGAYFIGLTTDGTTTHMMRTTNGNLPMYKYWGMCQETTGSFGLPATATPVVLASAYIPVFGFATVTTI